LDGRHRSEKQNECYQPLLIRWSSVAGHLTKMTLRNFGNPLAFPGWPRPERCGELMKKAGDYEHDQDLDEEADQKEQTTQRAGTGDIPHPGHAKMQWVSTHEKLFALFLGFGFVSVLNACFRIAHYIVCFFAALFCFSNLYGIANLQASRNVHRRSSVVNIIGLIRCIIDVDNHFLTGGYIFHPSICDV